MTTITKQNLENLLKLANACSEWSEELLAKYPILNSDDESWFSTGPERVVVDDEEEPEDSPAYCEAKADQAFINAATPKVIASIVEELLSYTIEK